MSDALEESTMTMTPRHFIGNWPHVLNMANSIIGVSVLALPFCFKQCGILLGFLLLMGSAWLTQLTCHLLMKSAFATKKRSYEYLAFHIFGRVGKLVVELSIIGLLIGTCIAFYIIIGDLGPAVVSKVTGLENNPQLRTALLIFLTGLVVVPLAMLHSLDSLSNFSAASLIFYCVFMVEVVIAAFPNLWSGIWVSKVVFWRTEGVFKCLPIFALCFACQTQLFIMSDALPEPSLNRINRIVHSAVVMCSVIYVSVGCFGYIAFCDDFISGDILMNFSPTFFSEAIKLGFVTSTLISFPLVIFPCRASLYTLLFVRKGLHDNFGGAVYIPPSYFKGITISIIGVTLTIGLLVPNIEFMLAITGATMGSLICYILPAVLFIMAISVDHGGNTRSFAQLVLLIGVTILLASSYVTLMGEEKAVKHESLVKLGQPIEHKEDNLPIHNDEELKKKLDEMKDQLPLVNAELDKDNPGLGGAIKRDVADGVTIAAVAPSVKQEAIDKMTVGLAVDKIKHAEVADKSKEAAGDKGKEVAVDKDEQVAVDKGKEVMVDKGKEVVVDKSKEVVVDKSKEVVVDKSKEVAVDKGKEVAVDKNEQVAVDESKKEVVVEDGKLPDTEEDKRKEPPNPHAPLEEVVAQEEKVEDSKKDGLPVIDQSKEDADSNKNRKLVERASDTEQTAEKELDEKKSQAIDGQQQASDAVVRPALVNVLQPKPENPKEIVNEKTIDSSRIDDKPERKARSANSRDVDGKLEVELSAGKVAEVRNDSSAKFVDLQNVPTEKPVEAQRLPETRLRKAPDEQPDLEKTMHAANKSAKAAGDVVGEVPGDQRAEQHEAKAIIEELKKQQQEQRMLLDEQRKIVEELKRHQFEVHKEAPAASQTSRGPDRAFGENADVKAKHEPVQKEEGKRERLAESLETVEKAGKVAPKVSSKEEHIEGEKGVVKDSSKLAKKTNENLNINIDNSNPIIDENKKKAVEKNVPILDENNKKALKKNVPVVDENNQKAAEKNVPIVDENNKKALEKNVPILDENNKKALEKNVPIVDENNQKAAEKNVPMLDENNKKGVEKNVSILDENNKKAVEKNVPILDENNQKPVEKNVVEMQRRANENLNVQDSNEHAVKSSKTGDLNRNALKVDGHPEVKNDLMTKVDNSQNKNFPKDDHVRNIDGIKQSQRSR